MAANFGCIRNAAGYNDWHQILIIGVHEKCPSYCKQTTEWSPGRTWYAGGGSFLLLPGWHAFCWWRLWNNGHCSCENSLEEVQGATTSSHIRPSLLQDPWPCIQLLGVERHASETWPLTKTNLQQNDRAMIRQICSIKPDDVAMVRSSELLALSLRTST